ncbi:MAG TPA: DUF2911 domain-containing protein [Vicinamibacteria bacterium]|nr:DUF2911 domain-containing protein [Vicinamibacteria bacterium]
MSTVCWALVGMVLFQSPRATAELSLNGATISVEYGRPSLKGRDLLSLAPVGTVWRLGADQSTTLTIDGTATFGTIVVRAGEYSLFLERTAADDWMLVVNSQTGQWGTEHDRRRDLLAVPLKWDVGEASTEQLTIELTKETDETGILAIRWGEHVLRQRFRLLKLS